jgi:hypothetical protein
VPNTAIFFVDIPRLRPLRFVFAAISHQSPIPGWLKWRIAMAPTILMMLGVVPVRGIDERSVRLLASINLLPAREA